MFNLMDKKIFTILRLFFFVYLNLRRERKREGETEMERERRGKERRERKCPVMQPFGNMTLPRGL